MRDERSKEIRKIVVLWETPDEFDVVRVEFAETVGIARQQGPLCSRRPVGRREGHSGVR